LKLAQVCFPTGFDRAKARCHSRQNSLPGGQSTD
jgi:hypothetical protein